MVKGFNRVILMGNLAADPELRYTPGGKAVASFRVAVNRAFRTPEGELKEEVIFVPVVAWDKTAELTTQYLSKGRGVLVDGRLNIRDYEREGEKRYVTEVVASQVVFLGGGQAKEADVNEELPEDVPFV